jgi:hypothetical protein
MGCDAMQSSRNIQALGRKILSVSSTQTAEYGRKYII